MFGALVLAALPAVPAGPPVHLAATPVASGGWLTEFNTWRANAGLSALNENTTWSAGDYDHALYMVKNDLVTHYETPGTPYYTTAGDTAARNSNIYVSSTTATTDQNAIDWWMQAPFHALGMMDPRLTSTGFGSYREVKSGWDMGAALDVLSGNSFSGGTYPVYFPGNGTSEPLTTYGGGEFPDPLQACSGYAAPTGLPVFVEVGGNVATTAGPTHSFTGNGVALAHCVIDSNSPSVGSGLSSRGGVIVVPRQPLQAGVKYTVSLTVNGAPYTWSFTVGPFFAITGLSPMGGVPAGGTAVTISGSAFTGATAVHFGTLAAASFSVVNDSTITAVSPAHALGTVDVTVTTPAGTTPITAADHYTYSTPCTSVTLSASPPSPRPSGSQVTFTAAAVCPSPNPQYEFWMRPTSQNSWTLIQAYSTSNQFHWNSTGAVAGIVYFGVWARDATSLGIVGDSTGSFDVNVSIPYTVTGTLCTAATISAAPGSPQIAGTAVTFTATSATCPNPGYEFWMRLASSNTWQLIQAYSTSNQFHWNSTGAAPGTIYFGVWAKDLSSPTANFDANVSMPFVVNAAPCSSVTISGLPASPQPAGTQVIFTAAAAGCSDPGPLYEFWMRLASSNTWQLIQAYSTSNQFHWNSTGAAPGTIYLGVWAKDAFSPTATFDINASTPYVVGTASAASCSSATITPTPQSVAHGTGARVTFSATASGCTNPNPQYQFWFNNGSGWQVVQSWSTTSTWMWNTTGAPAGTWTFVVWVRDASSPGIVSSWLGRYDAYAVTSATVT